MPRIRAVAWRSRRNVGMLGLDGVFRLMRMIGLVALAHGRLLPANAGVERWPSTFLRTRLYYETILMQLLFIWLSFLRRHIFWDHCAKMRRNPLGAGG